MALDEPVRWVADQAHLDDLVARLRRSDRVAVDTEFLTDRAYVPRLCLVQVATDEVVACVDVLHAMDFGPLWEVMREPRITKVFHAAENDLAVLRSAVGQVPAPVFDTQIAAALCGHGEAIGYADLVERFVGARLDKSLARTDWGRRPLPGKALQYAADDVRHLRVLDRELRDALEVRGRAAWAEEEFRQVVDPERYRDDPSHAWRRVRGHATLDARGLVVLREVARWREQEARNTNRPRRFVLSDEALCGIARRAPRTAAELDRVRGFEPGRHAGHRKAILAMVAHAGATTSDGEAPTRADPSALATMVRGIVEHAALRHGVPAGMIATTAETLRAAAGDRDVRLFRGWRRDVVGALVERFLDGEVALRIGRDGPILVDPASTTD